MATNNIRYLYNAETGIELIFCKNSTISYPLHNHVSVLTIGIILDGSVVLTINQEARIYQPNKTFVIFPYVPHSISAHDSYTLLSLCIDKDVINNVDVTTIQKHITLLLIQALNIGKINQYQILQLLNRLDEIAVSSEWQLKKHTLYIHNLKKQLELYPECKLTVDEMAQNAFISKYHFIRSFKAEVGLTPHQFQIQNRIRKAQRLIHKTETIAEVALTTGFCDQSHFIKQFEKYVGLPPLAYKSSSGTI
ncbi:helix-turn-helix domain-containing protein [Lachnospiraceae bacterium 45-W7]